MNSKSFFYKLPQAVFAVNISVPGKPAMSRSIDFNGVT